MDNHKTILIGALANGQWVVFYPSGNVREFATKAEAQRFIPQIYRPGMTVRSYGAQDRLMGRSPPNV